MEADRTKVTANSPKFTLIVNVSTRFILLLLLLLEVCSEGEIKSLLESALPIPFRELVFFSFEYNCRYFCHFLGEPLSQLGYFTLELLVTLYLIHTVTQIDVNFSNHLMSASVSLKILDKLVQVFFLLLVRDCRIM